MRASEEALREAADKAVYRPAVVGFVVNGPLVLLGERIRVSDGLGQNLLAGYGGKVGDSPKIWNETRAEAMARELLEETRNVHVLLEDLMHMGRVRFLYTHKPQAQLDVSIYLIKRYSGEPEETESMVPRWYNKTHLPADLMFLDNQFWLPLVLDEMQVDAVFSYGPDGQIIEMSVKVI